MQVILLVGAGVGGHEGDTQTCILAKSLPVCLTVGETQVSVPHCSYL